MLIIIDECKCCESRQYVTVDLMLYHSNESRAETYNTSVFLYLTKYVAFEQLLTTNFTGSAPSIINMTGNQAVSITVRHPIHHRH